MPRLLLGAIEALAKLLRHSDWRARDSAIEKILRVHGPALERLVLRLHLNGTPAGPGELTLLDDLNPQQREAVRVVMKALRPEHPHRGVLDRHSAPPAPEG
jgi:hypothetical protein